MIEWRNRKSPNPVVGECYYDSYEQCGYIWQGTDWAKFENFITEEPFIPPTKDQLEKYPSLKRSWEEFLVIKKLLGV